MLSSQRSLWMALSMVSRCSRKASSRRRLAATQNENSLGSQGMLSGLSVSFQLWSSFRIRDINRNWRHKYSVRLQLAVSRMWNSDAEIQIWPYTSRQFIELNHEVTRLVNPNFPWTTMPRTYHTLVSLFTLYFIFIYLLSFTCFT